MKSSNATLPLCTAGNKLRLLTAASRVVGIAGDNGFPMMSWSNRVRFLLVHACDVSFSPAGVPDSALVFIFTGSALCCFAILAVVLRKFNAMPAHGVKQWEF